VPGELFTEKYNYGDAAQFLADALQVNPNSARALVDVARNKRIEGGEETFAALERALTINPNLVGRFDVQGWSGIGRARLRANDGRHRKGF
jgi:hypothetical protein